jgi:hypothetical protein
MPEFVNQNFSYNIQCLEKIPLENGWEQWQLKSEQPLQITASSNVILDQLSMPVLWQIDAHNFICIKSAQQSFQNNQIWESFSISSTQEKNISTQNNQNDFHVLICPGNTLFYAIHQIQIWRTNKQLPNNLMVIAEANSNAAFRLQPSRIYSSLVPSSATAAIALLDDWGVLSRFSNEEWQPGCYQGDLKQLTATIELNLKDAAIHKMIF